MIRFTRLMLVLSSAFGFSMLAPTPSQAGVIPWMYDAIFGPVGSLRAGGTYAPMTAGYGGYSGSGMAYSGYSPMTVAYAPVSTASYGVSGSGCACNQSANYPATSAYDSSYGYSQAYYGPSNYGSSNCSSCNNCSTGYVGSVTGPTGSTTVGRPTPDNNSNILHRLDEIEHNQKEMTRFLKKQYKDDYDPALFRQNTYTPNKNFGDRENTHESTVPSRDRRVKDTFTNESDPNSQFPKPRRPVDPIDPLEEQERRKIEINPPPSSDELPNAPLHNDSTKPKEEEPQALRLDGQITTRAVAPRERTQSLAKSTKSTSSKTAIANSNSKKSTKVRLDSSHSNELVRH